MSGDLDLAAVRQRATRFLRAKAMTGATASAAIVSANDVPALVDEVERLRSMLAGGVRAADVGDVR